MKTLLSLLALLVLIAPARADKPPLLQDPWLTAAEPPPFPVPPLLGFWIEELEGDHDYTIEAKDGPGPWETVRSFVSPADIGDGALGYWSERDPGADLRMFRVRNNGPVARFLFDPFNLEPCPKGMLRR